MFGSFGRFSNGLLDVQRGLNQLDDPVISPTEFSSKRSRLVQLVIVKKKEYG